VLIVGIDGLPSRQTWSTGVFAARGARWACGLGGHGIEREVRLLGVSERGRPRRSICRACAVTHVLVPEDTLVRRRDGVEVIGAALVAKAQGRGHRTIAAHLGRVASTVRGWLRRFAVRASAIRKHFTAWAYALSPDHDHRWAGASEFSDAVEAIGMAGAVAVRRFGPRSPWLLASVLTAGRLLCNTSSPFPSPD